MSQQENNQSFWERVLQLIINHKRTVIKVIAFLVAVISPVFVIVNYHKNTSDLKVELVEAKQEYANTSEIATFNVNNISEDDKIINRAVVKILECRKDEEIVLRAEGVLNDTDLSIIVYNAGWSDIQDISFSLNSSNDFYNNVKNPDMFKRTYTDFEYGRGYELCTLTVEDLYAPKTYETILIDCHIKGEPDTIQVQCSYMYESSIDRFVMGGKGGVIDPLEKDCCIEVSKGPSSYEVPINYEYDKHGTGQIKLHLTADQSCSFRYVIQIYSGRDKIYQTPPRGTTIKIASYSPPAIWR